MDVSFHTRALPGPRPPLPAAPPQAPGTDPRMASAKRHVAALGSKRFFGDHHSLLPGQGVGQAEARLPAVALLRGSRPLGRRAAREEHLAWSFES